MTVDCPERVPFPETGLMRPADGQLPAAAPENGRIVDNGPAMNHGRLRRALCMVFRLVAALMFGLTMTAYAPAAAESPEGHIRVGYVAGSQQGSETRPSGYHFEYLRAVAQYTGWHYTFVGGTWQECLARLESGDIDLLTSVGFSEERTRMMFFPDTPAGIGGSRILCRVDDERFAYGDFPALDGKRIGVLAGSLQARHFAALCAKHGFSASVVAFDDLEKVFSSLDDHRVDLVLAAKTATIGHYRLVLDYDPQPFYFAVTRHRPDLLKAWNAAVELLKVEDPLFEVTLHNKYFRGAVDIRPNFTRGEKAYLRGNPVLTVAYDPAWPPLEYRDPQTGELTGIMRGIMDSIAATAGCTFRYVSQKDLAGTKDAFRGKARLFASVATDYDWADTYGCLLTRPLLTLQIFQVRLTDAPCRVTALPEGYYMTQQIQNRYGSGMKWRLYRTVEDCLEAVRNGDADAAFLNSYELDYYLSMPRYSKLKFQNVPGLSMSLSVGVSAGDDPMLFRIINKSAASITEEQLGLLLANGNHRAPHSSPLDLIYTHPVEVLVLCVLIVSLLLAMLFTQYKNRLMRRKSEELVRANAAKTDFLSRMSHDIRTPMNGIIGMTRIALEHTTDPAVVDPLKKIDLSSTFLLGLINDILDMSRIESGAMQLHPEPYPLDELLMYLDSIIRPLCKAKQQTFHAAGHADPARVPLLDKLRVNQVLFNLLSNAVKYTPAGGTITFQQDEIFRNGRLEIVTVVSDNGIGMGRDFLRTLFQPYTQEDRIRTVDPRSSGTGLGLAIVRKIVDAMQGSIDVASEKEKGSTFTLHIPAEFVTPGEMTRKKEQPGQDMQLLHGKRALVCEDNAINQQIIISILKKAGICFEMTGDGLSGMQRFESSPEGSFDFILMDIRMPGKDGFETTEAIRRMNRPDAATIPIIAMTADAFEDDIERCLRAGMNGHIAKPLEPRQFYARLISFLQRPGQHGGE